MTQDSDKRHKMMAYMDCKVSGEPIPTPAPAPPPAPKP